MKTWTKVVAVAVGAMLAGAAQAQAWPSRPIHVLVGFPPGTSPDVVARLTNTEMSKQLGGATFVVENRTGAGGFIAVKAVAAAAPDGYTIMAAGPPISSLLRKEPLILGKDFFPLGDIAGSPYGMFVRGSLGPKTYDQLVAYAKANPNKLNYGQLTPIMDFLVDALRRRTGLSYTAIPYQGGPIKEMLTGEVDFFLGTMASGPAFADALKDGRIVPVLFWSKHPPWASVPTAVDIGVMPVEVKVTISFLSPPGLPPEVTRRFSDALQASSKTPSLVGGLRNIGLDVYYTTPDQQLREYRAISEFYTKAMREMNYVPQE